MKNASPINPTRASREGHEFHEAWVARAALQLLLPSDNKLAGIAVEGLSPADEASASSETVEIADVVFYAGKTATFDGADSKRIIQCKYSIRNADNNFRASDAKKTITKFAAAFLDHRKRYGAGKTRDKLEFELVTNRPVLPAFEQAISSIAGGKTLHGRTRKQADQFIAASGLSGRQLIEFAGKLQLTGKAGSLSENKKLLSRTIVDWSAADDAIARARLGQMRQLVRDKAGSAGARNNVIRAVDVFTALDIADVDDLLPCPASLPEVGKVVPREQLAEAVALVDTLDQPLLVHASGGLGKTVFLTSLANLLSNKHKVLLFDCFGGGRYRAPEDARHLPKRGLVHIVNSLAVKGLCDPLLPGNESVESLMTAFRRRLTQCTKTIGTTSSGSQLVIMIDAIDNAAEHARDRNEPSFPTLLLQSLHHGGEIPGVKFIVSCRSHRIEISTEEAPYQEFKLNPFSPSETEMYLRDRLPTVTATEIQVAQSRSVGNPRILEHLVYSDRGLLEESQIKKKIKLDDLLNHRIELALADATNRGYKKQDIHAFLAGLSVLPPPVPLDEYAGAYSMDVSAIESFAADLAPLLERTKYGLMFRDEPTETLIRENYGSDISTLKRVAKNLFNRQDSSIYAARALPGLLQKLNNGKLLFELAFDERFPESIKSLVGRRKIQYARLKAAARHAATHKEYNRLVHLLVALSTIAAVDQKGADYILDYPDLVIAAKDVDATRRLFESRTSWPGTRHARLSIANALSSDFNDAYRHAASANEWIIHFFQQEDKSRHPDQSGPKQLDIAAIPFCLVIQKRGEAANDFMHHWKTWYAFEVAEYVFGLLNQAESAAQSHSGINDFLEASVNHIGVITAGLSFLELDDLQKARLIHQLSKAAKKQGSLELNDDFRRDENYLFQDGVLKASAIGAMLGFGKEGLVISKLLSNERPIMSSFQGRFSSLRAFQFLTLVALRSAIHGKEIGELDILPKELYEISKHMPRKVSGADFTNAFKKRLKKLAQTKPNPANPKTQSFSFEHRQEGENFLDNRLAPLLEITRALAAIFKASTKTRDKAFVNLLTAWEETRKKYDRYSSQEFNLFFDLLGSQFAEFILWTCSSLKAASVKKFLEVLNQRKMLGAGTIIRVMAILAKRIPLHSVLMEEAAKANSLIGEEYDVIARASLYAQLARAFLPASQDEAAAYFRTGLEQMDAIGSGDYHFTSELLSFASTLRGTELNDQDIQTLTNICELNMPGDEEKFPWFEFAKGLSRVSGKKALAKLSRWDDRSKVSLSYTLLPYLTALVTDDKTAPEDALALNILANPVELFVCDTAMFAKAIDQKNSHNRKMLVTELIEQYEINNPGIPFDKTVQTLASIAGKALGPASRTATRLAAGQMIYAARRNELNEQMNYRRSAEQNWLKRKTVEDNQTKKFFKDLVRSAKPDNEASMSDTIDKLNTIVGAYSMRADYFQSLRSKVTSPLRSQYVRIIARLENLNIYTKLDELGKCKSEWGESSLALSSAYKEIAKPLLESHAEDFISYDQFSSGRLQEISNLSGIPVAPLAIELIKVFTSNESISAATAWLGMASAICGEAAAFEGTKALTRLLNSESAKLASSVVDGPGKPELYPSNDIAEVASGLVWRMLGSPYAADRWRAAHSLRCFAKFERWAIIDAVVAKFLHTNAHPFQASELAFYHLHARLWLLIALARMALDYPKNIVHYQRVLLDVALDKNSTHVLLKHFASQAILTCMDAGVFSLSGKTIHQIRNINNSPFPRKITKSQGLRFRAYRERPINVPEPKSKFHLDYDFEKTFVEELGVIFGKPKWQISDMISNVVRSFDTGIRSMYENDKRQDNRFNRYGMTSKYHTYGQQLGWHAMFIVAGKLLSQFPVTDESYEEEPWESFLKRWLITRQDGLWLSDGTVTPPLSIKVNLLEKAVKNLTITGDRNKIEQLIGMKSKRKMKNIVVHGDWHSPDDIEVYIRSVLVEPRKSKAFARRLIKEEPFSVWLPTYDQYGDEEILQRNEFEDCIPWISHSSVEGMLDDDDPLGTIEALRRPRFSSRVINDLGLKSTDPFHQTWMNSSGKAVGFSEAWGYHNKYNNEPSDSGTQLICTRSLLKSALSKFDAELVLLIKFRRYEKGIRSLEGKFSHTVAVLRINGSLDQEYYEGAINRYTPSWY